MGNVDVIATFPCLAVVMWWSVISARCIVHVHMSAITMELFCISLLMFFSTLYANIPQRSLLNRSAVRRSVVCYTQYTCLFQSGLKIFFFFTKLCLYASKCGIYWYIFLYHTTFLPQFMAHRLKIFSTLNKHKYLHTFYNLINIGTAYSRHGTLLSLLRFTTLLIQTGTWLKNNT
jgi:hypothetical protein